jgi:8-oxo-dGTP diphosphatase
MDANEQGTREVGRQRYLAVPRTLIFLLTGAAETGDEAVLLLRGAAHKRLWAGRYNGLGGHVEAGEDVYTAAQRELREEAGLAGVALTLRGVVNIDTGADAAGPRPGVLMFVFVGRVAARPMQPTAEGTPEWVPLDRIHELPLVDDLPELLLRALHGRFFYGHYAPQPDGSFQYEFR